MICKNCQHENTSGHLFCQQCDGLLYPAEMVLKKINDKVLFLEDSYQLRIREIKNDIALLAKNGVKTEGLSPELPKVMAETRRQPEAMKIAKKVITKQKPLPKPRPKPVPRVPRVPSEFEKQVIGFFSPIGDGVDWLAAIFSKYKKEGKLPIFLMTLAGIVAMLFGFGYLMQVTLNKMGIYEPVIKIGLGFLATIVLAFLALRLYRKPDKYAEYASALAGLSIILNYLLIYFLSDLGDFPVLSSALLGFILILINTGFAIFLSLRFETKIVAVLSLIGGAFAPFLLNSTADGTFFYLYLWLLIVAANYIAVKIDWKTLHYISFIVAVTLIEFMVFTSAPSQLIYIIYYHLFAYLFFYYSFFRKFKLKEKIGKVEAILLAGNTSFFLFNLYFAFNTEFLWLGILYLANALVFVVLAFIFWKKLSISFKRILPIIIAAFVGLAIPALLNQALMGLFWSIEAMLLINLGFSNKMPAIRKEGYLVLLLGLGKMLFSATLIISHFFYNLWHPGFYNFVSLGVVFLLLSIQFKYFLKVLQPYEKKLYYIFRNGFPIWLCFIALLLSYEFIGNWTFPLALVPVMGLAWWGTKLKSGFLTSFSFLFLSLFLVAYLVSALQASSLRFTQQSLYAQISAGVFLAYLWSVKLYFNWLGQQNKCLTAFTHALRITFYVLLPLIFISFVNRRFHEFLGAGIWVSTLIPYFLFRKFRYLALQTEFIILFALAFFFSFVDRSAATMVGGLVSMGVVHLMERSYSKEGILKTELGFILKASPYVWLILLSVLVYRVFGESPFFAFAIYPALLLTIVYFKKKLAFIESTYKVAITFAFLMSLQTLFFSVFSKIYWYNMLVFLFTFVLMILLLVNKQGWYKSYKSKKWVADLIILQFFLVQFYWTALVMFNIDAASGVFSVLLALHAIGLLFISLKNKLKATNYLSIGIFSIAALKVVFVDIARLPMTQKVIVLIALGALLLAASYAYTRLKKHFEDKEGLLEEKEVIIDEKPNEEVN